MTQENTPGLIMLGFGAVGLGAALGLHFSGIDNTVLGFGIGGLSATIAYEVIRNLRGR